eukprot:403357357
MEWIIKPDCDSLGSRCQMNALVNDIRASSSFVIGGVMENSNQKYLSIYDIDANSNVNRAFFYKRIDGASQIGLYLEIKDLDIDYQQNYIFACYNTLNPSTLLNYRMGFLYQPLDTTKALKNLEFSVPAGDSATCLGMNYQNDTSQKVVSIHYSLWDHVLQKNRLVYIESKLSGYDDNMINPPTVFQHIAINSYPSTPNNIYLSVAFNHNIRIRYAIGTMAGPLYTSKTAGVIFSIEDYQECFDPLSFSPVLMSYSVIYEPVTIHVPQFTLSQQSGLDLIIKYEFLDDLVIKEDLRDKQAKYNSTTSCNLPRRLDLQYISDLNASRLNNECYYESDTCDLAIAYYAFSRCQENIELTFQIVSQNNTKEIFIEKNSTTSLQEHHLSLSRQDLNFEPLKVYNLTVRAIFYLDSFEYAVNQDIWFLFQFKSCQQEVKDSLTIKPNSYKYSIAHDKLIINYLEVNAALLPTCGDFQHQVQLDNGNPSKSISIDPIKYNLIVYSQEINDVGNFTVKIVVYINNLLKNQPVINIIEEYEIKINLIEFNNAPYFQTKKLENQVAVSGQQKIYTLPEVLDWEDDSYQIILVTQALETFTNLIHKKLVFSPQDQHVGVYIVKIKVAEINDQSFSNTYSFKLYVEKGERIQQQQNQEINGTQVSSYNLYNPQTDTWSESVTSLYSGDDKIVKQYLKVKIASISSTGEMTLLFDSQMMIPNNYALTLNDSLSILLVQSSKKYKVDYSINSFQGQIMKLQLKFPIDTKYISATQVTQIYIT